MSFDVTETKRRLTLRGQNRKGGDFKADIVYEVMPGLESLVMAVPFAQKGHFYLNQKINCMPVTGCVRIGRKVIEFKPDTAFGLLDWGRGVWPFIQSWYWGNGSHWLPGPGEFLALKSAGALAIWALQAKTRSFWMAWRIKLIRYTLRRTRMII